MADVNRHGAVDVVSVDQPLTGDEAQNVSARIERCLGAGQPQVVLDLSGVPLIDSQGLEYLLELHEQFQLRGGLLKLAGANELCRDVLRITGVGERFELHDDVDAAVGSFAR